MLAFQLSGALLLLLNCVKGTKEAVIKNCFPGSNIVERDDDNNCTIPREKMRESAHKIYLNIVAFGDLVIGYAIAAFSPISLYRIGYTLLFVSAGTLIMLIAEYYLTKLVAQLIYAKDEIVPYEDLTANGVETTITNAEIDAICNGTYGSEEK